MDEKMDEKSKNKTCENCYYYAQHYTKCKAKLIKTNCGHCNNVNRKSFSTNKACDLWKSSLLQEKEKRESVEKVLRIISEKLIEITMLLQC